MSKVGIYEKSFPDDYSLEKKIELTKQYGFDFMELCIDTDPKRIERLSWDLEQWQNIRNQSDRFNHNFETISLSYLRLIPLGTLDNAVNKKALEAIERTLQIAKILDVKVLLINAYDVYEEPSTDQTANQMIENLKKAGALAEQYDVVIGLENAEMEIGSNIEKVSNIINKVNSSHIKIYGDIANSTIAHNGDVDKVVNELKTYNQDIVSIHLKDGRNNEYRGVPFGSGFVRFDILIPLLKSLNQKRYMVEYFNEDSWEADLVSIIEMLSPYFQHLKKNK